MKRFFLLAGFAATLFACNNDSATVTVDKDSSDNAARSTERTYTSTDGDVSYRDGKLVVWRNGAWVESNEDVRLENGTVIRRNGEVERDGKVVVLEDGEVVDRTGRFFDRAGNAIENAWDKTKEGVKEAGKEVKEGAKKVGEEVKDVFKDDKKDNN